MSSNGLRIREDLLSTDAKGRENDRARCHAEKVLKICGVIRKTAR
jgi:hypothetical protein